MNRALEGLTQRERLHEFFSQFVLPTPGKTGVYGPDNLFTTEMMRQSAELLLKESVFGSKKEMKLEALRDFEVIIPDEIFESRSKEEK